MKTLFTLATAFMLCAFSPTISATGGPDAYGYTWITSLDVGGPTYNWIDITARPGVQTVTGLADDNSAPAMAPLGFSFHYYWNDYTQMKVGSNGWLSFNNVSNVASCFPTIPTAGGAGDNLLAPLMGDLNFTGAGNIGNVRYWSNNIDTFIISYINVPFWVVSAPGWAGSNSFQVILCNSDSSITFQYGALGGFVASAGCIDMTVGIENSTGGIGLQVHSDVMPPMNYVIRFEYPAVVLLSIQDALPSWNDNAANGAKFIINNNAYNLRSDIRNAGNTGITAAINLTAIIQNAVPATVHSTSGLIPSLAAGDDSLYAFPSPWTPTAIGQYTFQTSLTCSQDINPANNSLSTELEVVDVCGNNMVLSYNTTGLPTGTLNWNGGANDDGAAVYFAPPVYPYTISALQYYISTNTSDGFIAQIYDDDGLNGGPGTQLFTTTVPSTSVVAASWNTVNVTSTVTLNSGGFYVVWLQGGSTIFLGTETAGPRSHHNYEILDAAWSTYRADDVNDLYIRCAINNYVNLPTSVSSAVRNGMDAICTDMSTGLVTGWLWDFGDATTSTLQNPVHTYSLPGTYTVCLTASSPCGTSQSCNTINVCALPTAAYSSTTSALNANFTDQSTGTVFSYQWDFGDASTSTLQNPSHTYATPGTYTVCLIVSNLCGDADTICQTVSLCNGNTAGFGSSSSGLNSTFGDQSTGAIDNYFWDFGDPASGPANTSTIQNPVHTFTAPGMYTVCLIVSNTCGFADTTCQTVTVCELNTASFSNTTNEDSVFVTDMSTGAIATWLWDFGDGNFSSLQNPGTHLYATGGVYLVCLTTTDTCGIVDSVCQTVIIMITDIRAGSLEPVSIYPNPANDVLFVNMNGTTVSAVEIFNMTGQIVYTSGNEQNSIFEINVSELAAGMYTVRVINADGVSVRRFTKE